MVRSSAATSNYEPFAARQNLHVVVDTTVTHILRVWKRSNLFRKVELFRMLEVSQCYGLKIIDTHDQQIGGGFLTAQKEVKYVVCRCQTSNILLHSGIGDSKELERVRINTSLMSESTSTIKF
ncbi:hypothetical protein BDQ17DRAFT_332743 [Cyathus striatus]|nr:hypothetical protein BDQ17DRAFT_332743 [Cyathus striatus]